MFSRRFRQNNKAFRHKIASYTAHKSVYANVLPIMSQQEVKSYNVTFKNPSKKAFSESYHVKKPSLKASGSVKPHVSLFAAAIFVMATILKDLQFIRLAGWLNRKLTKTYPNDPGAWSQAVEIAVFEQNPLALQVACKQALRTLKQSSWLLETLKGFPSWGIPKRLEVMGLLKQFSDASFACGDSNLALKGYHQVLKRMSLEDESRFDVDSANVLTTIGQLYSDAQQPLKALYYYRQALRLAHDKPYLHSRIGYVLIKLQDFEGALTSYQKALTCASGKNIDATWQATVCITLAQLSLRIYEQPTTALAWTQAGLSAQPNNPAVLSQVVDLFNELDYLPGVLHAYQCLLPFLPQTTEHLNYLGYLYWQLNRNQEAQVAYQHAIETDVENWIAYNNLGIIYLDESQEPEKALGYFEKALTLNVHYTMACFNLARTHAALGHRREAARYYQQALELNLEQPELESSEIEQRLAELFEG
ncbi:MAG: tetratricopeptide repeat protein [Vampirovibrionales bacterium]|nr:tetratricopeptide repeat protein [Vampirovibrionales bacterium]